MDRWIVLLHVVAAFWFVGGLLGRDVTLARARRDRDIGAVDRGEVTDELSAAFRDRAVAWARGYETAVVAVVIVLMVIKPF